MGNITHIRCEGVKGELAWEDRHLFNEGTHEWIALPFEDYDVFTCNDCGTHANTVKDIKHHPTCKPGDSEKWEAYYTKVNEEEGGDII